MDYHSHLDAVVSARAALLTALADAAPDDLVPTCEGWKIADLTTHVGKACELWTGVLCGANGHPTAPGAEPPQGDDLLDWVSARIDHLVDELSTTSPETSIGDWFGAAEHAGFVARRCAHELTVHRYDAQSSTRACTPIALELARDGIDEVLDTLVKFGERTGRGSGRVLALRSTDTDACWMVTIEHDRILVQRPSLEEAALQHSDVVVTGTTSDLELTLYHRPTLSPVDLHGDYTVLEEWHHEFTF
jgi:uncharacterized protein (TIGR03083 family)